VGPELPQSTQLFRTDIDGSCVEYAKTETLRYFSVGEEIEPGDFVEGKRVVSD